MPRDENQTQDPTNFSVMTTPVSDVGVPNLAPIQLEGLLMQMKSARMSSVINRLGHFVINNAYLLKAFLHHECLFCEIVEHQSSDPRHPVISIMATGVLVAAPAASTITQGITIQKQNALRMFFVHQTRNHNRTPV